MVRQPRKAQQELKTRQEPKTRQERKEDTRERVRRAAYELFVSDGFDETTTKAIADRAEVAAGTVFTHARDKEDLLCLVMAELLRDAVAEGVEQMPEVAPIEEQLRAMFRPIFAMYAAHMALARPFIRTFPSARGPNGDVVTKITFEFLGRIAAVVTGAQARGEIDDTVPALLLANNLFALYFFSLLGWISGHTTIEGALQHLDMSFELQLRGVRAR